MIKVKSGLPVTSLHQERLFLEFLRWYKEFHEYRIKEYLWFSLVISVGSLLLISFLILNYTFYLSIVLLGLLLVALRKYLRIKESADHSYVNVHILKHHILGKLDVGFCQHPEPCSCAENFRRYVWVKYGISLYEKM